MYPNRFAYSRASNFEEALKMLVEGGEDVKILAGGQSLIPLLKLRVASPQRLLDIGRLPGLASIRINDNSISIGALTRHVDVERFRMSKGLEMLSEGASLIADPQVRNLGTVGGTLAEADPAADWGAMFLALETAVSCRNVNGERKIPLKDFFLDAYTTALQPDEILTDVAVTLPAATSGSAYVKFERKAGDFAIASAAVMVQAGERQTIGKIGIGLGGVGLTPVKAVNAENILTGQEFSLELLAKAKDVLMTEIEPLSDLRGSSEYKREVAGVIFQRAFQTAWKRARGVEKK